ncbi:DDHD domain-containing protein [Neurospora crassa]|nr:DDHD domain-containing protein [Neurospora crassa]
MSNTAETHHTFGPSCRLAPITEPEPIDGLEGIPPINAQFFYSSTIPIDDPLSAATTVGSSDAKAANLPLRPFSPGDNRDLERAWLGFSSDRDRRNHRHAQRNRSPSPSLSKENAEKLAAIVALLAAKHKDKHDREGHSAFSALATTENEHDHSVPVCCAELSIDADAELRKEFCAVTRRRQPTLDHDRLIQEVMAQLTRLWANSDTSQESSAFRPSSLPLGTSPLQRLSGSLEVKPSSLNDNQLPLSTIGKMIPRPPVVDAGISGKPFVRVESLSRSVGATPEDKPSREPSIRGLPSRLGGKDSRAAKRIVKEAIRQAEDSVEVPVGISRLHMVSLPVLQMKPIYWSPVNDISTVQRATWFYRDTMTPVKPAVANQLEAGYRELRVWGQTWKDELKSALDVGALGEEKVSHPLWPEIPDKRPKVKDDMPPEPPISSDPFCAARCFRGEAAAEGTLEHVHPDQELPPPPPEPYANFHVIYKDKSAAFLLRPSQKPSAYHGRRPLQKIMRGITVGIPVVRGFDQAIWDKIHQKKGTSANKAPNRNTPRQTNVSGGGCPACQMEQDRGQVTDLLLIAHGIGQKFAERVESFHFTHAVNAFRRAVNIELENPMIKPVLRPDQNGIMVLPVNWRHLLSFEDGGPSKEEDASAYTPDGFGLKDIEPNTIPAVRSMISDVMFDIPFYMSHHKPKMIAALVGEANRVYRLWCKNNPGFADKGRVHLIGHSLGSAMAVEILSKQPTSVPRPLDLSGTQPETRHFEFDTTNLFLLGSPAAFFLLLERGSLVPRRGRLKPGADAADTLNKDIVGDLGRFGCIAVDNIYNILAKEDPIAYLLNGTIDPIYASSLKTAYVPTFTTSFFKSVSDSLRGLAGLTTSTSAPTSNSSNPSDPSNQSTDPTGHQSQMLSTSKPPTFLRLPSQLELEVHDFSREEVAEKKAFLLNDNGQIDYYLRSGGGPLEIQYLNMLSAHTSYWNNLDLIRFLCIEIGRRPGRENSLGVLRADKIVRLRKGERMG